MNIMYMLLHLLEWCCWFIRPTPRGRVAPEGGGRINRNTTTKGVIKCLFPVARWLTSVVNYNDVKRTINELSRVWPHTQAPPAATVQ